MLPRLEYRPARGLKVKKTAASTSRAIAARHDLQNIARTYAGLFPRRRRFGGKSDDAFGRCLARHGIPRHYG